MFNVSPHGEHRKAGAGGLTTTQPLAYQPEINKMDNQQNSPRMPKMGFFPSPGSGSEAKAKQIIVIEDSSSEDELTGPPGAIPPVLPPSVEEAYRRKCIQLKQRLNEVEEGNDAARLRLVRMRRGIEKLRLERAFLLEQLDKRVSTNVEDSEGSPSPPPTVC